MPSHPNEANNRATWTVEMEEVFLQLLIEQIQKGKRSDSGFKTEAWKEIKNKFNEIFNTHFELQQFKTKYSLVSMLEIP